jgi:hypothetical protein
MKPVDVDRLIAWLEEHANDRAGEPAPLLPWQRRLLEDVYNTPLRLTLDARRACSHRSRIENA